jgi:hypothetical protein
MLSGGFGPSWCSAPSAEANTAYDSGTLTLKIMDSKHKMLNKKRQKQARAKVAQAVKPAQDFESDL